MLPVMLQRTSSVGRGVPKPLGGGGATNEPPEDDDMSARVLSLPELFVLLLLLKSEAMAFLGDLLLVLAFKDVLVSPHPSLIRSLIGLLTIKPGLG